MEANETPSMALVQLPGEEQRQPSWVSSLKSETPEETSLGVCLEIDVKGPEEM